MKMNAKTLTALAVCTALLAGAVATTALAARGGEERPAEPLTTVSAPAREEGDRQDETVYVFADAAGATQKVVVSDWLRKNGGDVYTKRQSEEQLPVGMTVTYWLDGEEIKPSQLAGKSGHLNIRYEFTNRQTRTAVVQGQEQTLYVPFAVLTGVILDNNVFDNVQVEGGRLVNDGDRTMVIGTTFPGMNANLNTDELDLPERLDIEADVTDFEMMNTMSIVTNEVFSDLELDQLDDLDSLSDDMDELLDAMSQLKDGTGKLSDGLNELKDKSGELTDGVNQLYDGSKKLKDGAGTLVSGVNTLSDGMNSLSGGLTQLSQNSAMLNDGAGQVFDTLLATANSQIAAAGLEVPALTRDNYADVLNGVIGSLDENKVVEQVLAAAREQVTAAVMAQKDQVTAGVTAAVQAEVEKQATAKAHDMAVEQGTAKARGMVLEQVLAQVGMTKEQYEAGVAAGAIPAEQQAQIEGAVDAQMQSEKVQGMIAAGVEAAMQSEEVRQQIAAGVEATMKSEEIQGLIAQKTQEKIDELIEQNMNSPEVQQKIAAALEQAHSGAASLVALKGQLDSYNTFYRGLLTYTGGVDSAKAGADQLVAGVGKLSSGAGTLKDGTAKLFEGVDKMHGKMPDLVDGVNQLADGGAELKDGVEKFDREGIQKLADAVKNDVEPLVSRLRATLDVSKQYTGLSPESGTKDTVKFLYRTEAID